MTMNAFKEKNWKEKKKEKSHSKYFSSHIKIWKKKKQTPSESGDHWVKQYWTWNNLNSLHLFCCSVTIISYVLVLYGTEYTCISSSMALKRRAVLSSSGRRWLRKQKLKKETWHSWQVRGKKCLLLKEEICMPILTHQLWTMLMNVTLYSRWCHI